MPADFIMDRPFTTTTSLWSEMDTDSRPRHRPGLKRTPITTTSSLWSETDTDHNHVIDLVSVSLPGLELPVKQLPLLIHGFTGGFHDQLPEPF